jgi:hypothetical protein
MTIDTSSAALRNLADEALCNTAFVPKSLLLAVAAEKEAQAGQEPFAWASYGLMPNGVTGWRFATHKSTFWDDKSQRPLYLAPQPSEPAHNHIAQHRNMVEPADVPLPEPDLASDFAYDTHVYGRDKLYQYAEAYAHAVMAAQNHTEQHLGMVKLIEDVERCYRMLLTEANAKAALSKAEEMLRAALADARGSAVLKANGIGGE